MLYKKKIIHMHDMQKMRATVLAGF